ncbi:OmpA family protein [Sulfitobacter mediterraneus]|uniref:OmpA family protein n=1 Tax=Sulfitobacter mediterraneus TaxID=83219 RepID=UPI001932C222|nr:OmpA family protein [Sulfitobacter mediterraneus]MBM1633627.1 OmpA family protein [Sulfitobacter mediterraneus]MBM1641858.1 OmpA family protein [Sulfitobacter mediterraneus]MBM1645491.1 OmpA family protein [Sulfitobacter mediterraneus]MBM1649977.1 OmpA family protein [Sulfitobacter mediterraneus]MBM1653560.1 OmpA family protein [Sulfitobacter mediterraneus]
MRLSALLIISLTFTAAAVVSLVAANFSVKLIEESSEIGVRDALDANSMTWAEVQADGLQVTLSGIAPTEAIRFHALTTAGSIVDAARVIDEMEVEAQAAIAPPRFSAEVLRNDSGISIIGLVPTSTDRAATVKRFTKVAGDAEVTDLLEAADYPAPPGWEEALAFAINAIAQLPRAKASVEAGHVSITAISDSPEAKAAIEAKLRRAAPPSLTLVLDIAAPRPVITPFALRFGIDENGARFDACSADTEEARIRILAAGTRAGVSGTARCTVGLGVPSPNWAKAVTQAIDAVQRLEGGSVTFADADITLVALPGSDQAQFDRVVGELETSLPEVFALRAKLPKLEDPNAGPPEFTATLSPEGQVQLRGRVSDQTLRELADSYAKARFGSDKVYTAARIAENLPGDWTPRVLTGLEALAALNNGAVTVTPDSLSVTGNTGNPDASTEIASLLSDKLGEGADYKIDVTYQEKLDPVLGLPTPDECEAEIGEVLKVGKINFEPGSATIDASALGTMDDIAEILKRCGDLPLEIQGHTDSQGRESMNLALSQSRAESVLNELRARRVLTGSFTAKGYGEATPIADNKTEAGREENRRIEFKLIRPDTVAIPEETTLESVAESGDTPEASDAEGTSDEQN